jgi:hypothetical protein
MKEFEVTFIFNGSEVGHLVQAKSIEEATEIVAQNLREYDVWVLDDGIGIVTKNVQHFLVSERP